MKALAAWFCVAAVCPAAAVAQTRLITAVPAPGSAAGTAPYEVLLTFDQAVDPTQSTIAVTAGGGDSETSGPVHTEARFPARLGVPLKPLQPGKYRVDWSTVGEDGRKSAGSFMFSVTQ
jgi:methionine-rich copper-binding protein CopC